MSSNIAVLNSENTEFNFSNININTHYNIIIHCVYDPYNNFENEFAFLKDPALDKNTLVILWQPVEIGIWDQYWIDKLNSVLETVQYRLIYLTGCSKSQELYNYFNIKFDVRFFPVFDVRASNLWRDQLSAINLKKSKKFCCLNAKDLAARRFIFSQLHGAGLVDQGTVSYKCTNWGKNSNQDPFYFFTQDGFTDIQLAEIVQAGDSVYPILPINIDDSNIVCKLPRSVFLDSYVNVVNETDFTNNSLPFVQSFITEKTFNAIANNQLFIVVGHPLSLQTLRDLGYKTFDGIIDESYDTIIHNGDRLMAVRDEMLRFLNRPIEAIQQDYEKAQDIIVHNRNLLFNSKLDQRLQALFDSL